MQLSFASLLSLVVLVTSVQALPAQDKRSPTYGLAERENDDAAATAAGVEKRAIPSQGLRTTTPLLQRPVLRNDLQAMAIPWQSLRTTMPPPQWQRKRSV
ncbi:hypothetical protein BJ138DRAFT_1145757, partial [Hygrophoropsis aurantiaca]